MVAEKLLHLKKKLFTLDILTQKLHHRGNFLDVGILGIPLIFLCDKQLTFFCTVVLNLVGLEYGELPDRLHF